MSHISQEDTVANKLNFNLWRRLLPFAFRHPGRLFAVVACAIVLAAVDGAFALVTRATIDDVLDNGAKNLWTYAWIYLGLTTLLASLVVVFIHCAGGLSIRMSHDIRLASFQRLQELEFAFFDTRPVGWLISRLTSDCDRLARIIAWGLLDVSWGTSLVLMITLVLFWMHWKLALVVLSVMPAIVVLSYFFQKIILRSSREIRKFNSQITAAFNEAMMGVKTTKTLVREEENLGEFQTLTGGMFNAAYRNARQSAIYYPLVLSLGSLAGGLALWQGGLEVQAGLISLGTLVAFINYAGQFFQPIHQIARVLTEMQGAQAAGERVIGLLETKPAIVDSPAVRERMERFRARSGQRDEFGRVLAVDGYPEEITEIRFDGVHFAYATGEPVLQNFHLRVKSGQRVALVGPSGGGKSTIVSLVCRFYEPTAGSILIDGVDYRERSLDWLQSKLGIVLQTPHLFAGSVRENIRYGRLSATDAEVEEAARLVQADGFIRQLEKGYQTEVGEGGTRLSTGQKQLLSFARALLANPAIFIMDEATSSIDTETEQLIQQGMEELLRGRISFIIAHRLSTIRHADLILVIEKGHIVESGNHESLLRQRGHYYHLYTRQYLREEEETVLEGGAFAAQRK